jgi:hypothetical protein
MREFGPLRAMRARLARQREETLALLRAQRRTAVRLRAEALGRGEASLAALADTEIADLERQIAVWEAREEPTETD